MRVYQICYDLMSPGQNWDSIDAEIEKIKVDGGRVMQSTWVITTSLDAGAIRDRLVAVADPNDKILVTRVTTPSAWSNALSDAWRTWLKGKIETYA